MIRTSVFVALCLAAVQAHAQEKPLRVYFIGNSVTDTINYRALAELAESRGCTQVWGRHMIPGAPLQWIWEHPKDGFQEQPFGHYPTALANFQWDVLSLQPFDRHLDGADGDIVMAKNFIDLALPKSPELQVYVYARWPRQGKDDFDTAWLKKYTGGWDGTNETEDYFERLTLELRKAYPKLKKPILMVPVGHVMYDLNQRMKAGKVPGYTHIKQLFADGIHLNNVGSYVVGCTYFATLYKQNPKGLPGEPYKVTDSKLAQVIQETVWKVVSRNELAEVAIASENQPIKRLDIAKGLVAQMAAGQFDKGVEPFDPIMTRALPADKLKEAWDGLTKQYGPFQRATETTTEKVQQYEVVYVTCEFQRGKLDTKVVFTSENKITGLFFVPSGKYKPPSYADPSKFEEKEIVIGKGTWRLPGTLSLPKGTGPFPSVILVHGSGPNDRDETIGPNKPFRDLAHGLASRGIAVLRYEKRTKHHAILMALSVNTITVKEETIDDAVAAFEGLASQEKIDAKRIFILGHSLGGMLIPRIGKAAPNIAGFISLAGSTRPLEDVILEQTRYILSLDGKLTPEAEKKLNEIEQQVAKVKSAQLSKDTPMTELPLGGPAKYWLDLRGYDPADAAKSLSKPMLILQGERDYQATMEDFANWKKALGSRNDVAFISYPRLNHLFVEGEGKSTPAEYSVPGNVAKAVVDDIAKWIKSFR